MILLFLVHALAAPAELIPGVAPELEVMSQREVDTRARELGRSLRCPVCQGSNITDSPSGPAKAMFERTRQLLAAGYSEEQVTEYFVDKYGEFILLDPQTTGLNSLLYVVPALGLGLGFLLALRAVFGWRTQDDDLVELPTYKPDENLDEYERRLLEELDSDDI